MFLSTLFLMVSSYLSSSSQVVSSVGSNFFLNPLSFLFWLLCFSVLYILFSSFANICHHLRILCWIFPAWLLSSWKFLIWLFYNQNLVIPICKVSMGLFPLDLKMISFFWVPSYLCTLDIVFEKNIVEKFQSPVYYYLSTQRILVYFCYMSRGARNPRFPHPTQDLTFYGFLIMCC